MSKDLPDLRTQAVEIKDATLQGENTADRVGGMLVDLVDYLDTLHIDQVHLGAFLTALNNSDPQDPSEGVVLTFLGSDWGFSTAVTRLQISHERIKAQMASDEETMRALEDNFSQTIQDVDRQLVDLYGQDARFATWQEQTDMHIISIAGVFDPETGELIGYSNITQTATEISQSVVGQKMNNLADPDMWEQGTTDNEAADKTYDEIKRDSTTCLRTKPLLPVSKDSYILFTPTNNNYSIYVLYFNSEKKLCSSATHLSPGWIRLRDESIGKKAIIEQDDVQYVAFMLKKNDDSVITPNEDLRKLGLTLFNSNVTSYAEFKITSESIKSTVTDNKEAADAAFNNLDNVVIPGINGRLDDVEEESGNSATWIYQNKDKIALVAAQFDDEGNLINTSGLVVTSGSGGNSFASLFSTQVDEQGVAHTADLRVYVEHDEDGNIVTGIKMKADQITMDADTFTAWVSTYKVSADDVDFTANNFSIAAGKIDFTGNDYTIKAGRISYTADDYSLISQNVFIQANQVNFTGDDTFEWTVRANDNIIFHLDHYGNLEIAGTLKQCQITENITIGTGTNKMYIEPTSTGARLVGKEGGTEVLSLGFNNIASTIRPSLKLGMSYLGEKNGQFYGAYSGGLSTLEYYLYEDSSTITLYNNNDGVVEVHLGVKNGRAYLRATDYGGENQKWPTEGVDNIDALPKGTVYVRNDWCLGIKR